MKMIWMCSIVVGCAAVAAGSQVMAQQTPPPSQAATSQDKIFVQKAAEGGLDEVQLGQLAAQKAENPDVKAFGEKMVRDHTMLNNQVKPVAESIGVEPPDHLNAKDQAEYDKLNAISGKDFDRAYLRLMVMAHRADLRAFRHEEATTQDSQLKQTVAGAVKVITEHLRMVTDLAQKNDVQTSSREKAGA